MICKASIVSVIYVVTFTQNAELFCPKKLSVFRKCGVFFASSAFAEDKKETKKCRKQGSNPGPQFYRPSL